MSDRMKMIADELNPKEKMLFYCSMHRDEQGPMKKHILKALEEFLKIASKEELSILNCDPSRPDDYPGLLMFAECFALFGAYGNRFYNMGEG